MNTTKINLGNPIKEILHYQLFIHLINTIDKQIANTLDDKLINTLDNHLYSKLIVLLVFQYEDTIRQLLQLR